MMNYREEVLNDKNVVDRLSTTSTREAKLCDQLSKLAVVQEDVQPSGLLSRIKSTLFSSHEASIRFPFVTSCTIISSTGRSRDPANHFCVRADGRCCLLKPVLESAVPSATEVASYSLPPSADGYCSTSLYLGSRQGSLVAVSLDEGRIMLLSVSSSEISLAKTLNIPVNKPISHLCLKDRNGLVELYVGVDKKDVFILPDVRKSDKFAFLYSDEIRFKIKQFTVSTLTHSYLEKLWCGHKSSGHPSPLQATVLLGSRFDPFKDSLDFFANYVFEAIEEMVSVRGSNLPPSVRIDCLRRIKAAIAHAVETKCFHASFYPNLIQKEVERLIKSSASLHIDSIEYDETSEKVVIVYDSGLFREIVPIDSELTKYVLTFLSLPVTFQITNKTLSQSAAADLFEGTKNWLNVFACCSVGEAGDSVPPPVAEYLNACISQSGGSAKQLVEKTKSFLQSELVRSLEKSSARNLQVQIYTMEYLMRNLFALEKFANCADDKPLSRVYSRLRHARYVLDRLGSPGEDFVASRCESIKCVEDFLNQLGTIFFSPRIFSPNIGFVAASVDVSHDTLAKFHAARICVGDDIAKAWKTFVEIEMEIALFVDMIKPPGVPPLGGGTPPAFHYYQYLLDVFSGNYEYEVMIMDKLVVLSRDEKISEQLRNNAIEKSIANGDWERVKKYIDSLPVGRRPDMIRLMCTEARIRNELPKIFDMVKSSPEMIQMILGEIDADLESNFTLSNAIQAYNLNLVVKNFAGAINAAIKIYEGLLCPYTCIAGTAVTDDTVFDIVDINMRLDWQLKSLVLARSVYGKCGRSVRALKYSIGELEKRLVVVDGLRALYSYTEDPIEAILDSSGRGVSVVEICRNLAAVGLVKLASKIARKFNLDIFKAVILPYVELILKCQKDSSFLPPCRFEKPAEGGLSVLLPPVTPSMAFTRSDSTGPISSGGDQLRAMYMMLESILRSPEIPNWVVMDTIEFLYLNLSSGCPSALIAIGEERGMWLELLRMHMRAENFREAVRLVECHVKYWKPRVVDGFDTKMRLDVPLLVQLQRALDIVRGEYPDADWLSDKLAQSLDELKSTLMLLSQRMIIANGN